VQHFRFDLMGAVLSRITTVNRTAARPQSAGIKQDFRRTLATMGFEERKDFVCVA
jgi:hypothetical protein